MITLIESTLHEWINTQRKKNIPTLLVSGAEYALFSGGKRIRPRLMLSSAQALGLSLERVIPLAVAIELYHTFSLVHDDLPGLDNDDLRRGVPTVHRMFGEAQAILIGDWLLHESMRMIYRFSSSHELMTCFEESTGGIGVIGGQSIELTISQPTEKEIHRIHDQKTAALFRFSVAAPSFLHPTLNAQFSKNLLEFGTSLGLAFQAADDLEDKTPSRRSSQEMIKHFSQSLDRYEKWFKEPIWPGNTELLCTACREVVNKLRSSTQ
ncbi:MAG: polyprenyl synthetase family protein [Xanthomonadaceae bacterium]|nr:polyprenyl synthetase family protein [Xanthomonadaceae bacterium]